MLCALLRPGAPRPAFPAIGLLALVFAVFGLALPADALPSQSLKLGYMLAKDSPLGAGATAFADELARRTGGRITVEQIPNAVLGGEAAMMKALQLGMLDVAFVTGRELPGIVPQTALYSIPFLFKNAGHARAVLDGEIGQGQLDMFRAKGFVGLAWGETGVRHLTNSEREIRKPGDLKGLKLCVQQSDITIAGFRALGAEPAYLPLSQLPGALRSGQLDGEENTIAAIQMARLNEVQPFLSLTGHVYEPALFLTSTMVFDALSAQDRAAVVEAARAGARASREYAADFEAKAVAALIQSGMKVTVVVDRSGFAAGLASVMPDYRHIFGAELLERVQRAANGS